VLGMRKLNAQLQRFSACGFVDRGRIGLLAWRHFLGVVGLLRVARGVASTHSSLSLTGTMADGAAPGRATRISARPRRRRRPPLRRAHRPPHDPRGAEPADADLRSQPAVGRSRAPARAALQRRRWGPGWCSQFHFVTAAAVGYFVFHRGTRRYRATMSRAQDAHGFDKAQNVAGAFKRDQVRDNELVNTRGEGPV